MRQEKGFIYIWALAAVALTGVLMAGIGQVWQTKSQREKETELLFVGEQYRKAFMSYYNGGTGGTGGTKQYPESLEQLLLDKRAPIPKRHLRKIYLDPLTNSIEWGLIAEPIPEKKDTEITTKKSKGIIGVYSLSKEIPIKTGNFPDEYAKFAEAATYQDWQFIYEQGSENNAAKQPQSPSQPGSSASGASPFSSQPSDGGTSDASPSSPFSSGGSSGSTSPSPESSQNPFAQ